MYKGHGVQLLLKYKFRSIFLFRVFFFNFNMNVSICVLRNQKEAKKEAYFKRLQITANNNEPQVEF